MEHNSNCENPHSRTKDKKHDAAKVMLTFSAHLTEKVTGVPCQCDPARVLGVPQGTLAKREKALIEKHWQLSTSKRGIFWALAKHKKGYLKINKATQTLLVPAFKDHPHVFVSPIAKDMLQLKNPDDKKVAVSKMLTQVGLGTIFSDMI
jgi:hypothetical protein